MYASCQLDQSSLLSSPYPSLSTSYRTTQTYASEMKALIYAGPGQTAIVDKPIPQIENSNQAVVRMLRTTICGTDLHIVRGEVPTAEVGRTLGHEGIGVVEEVGAEVQNFKRGDRVVIAAVVACAKCNFCRKG
jgi:alcohol dehydrogenase